jgi:hypothetical protein
MDFDPSASDYSLTSETCQDLFIAKYTEDGDFIWAKSVEIDIGLFVTNNELVVDQMTNDIYITSGFAFASDVDFDPGPDEYILSSVGSYTDIGILKLNSNGDFIWERKIGNTHHNRGFDLELDSYGNIWTTGSFTGFIDFKPGTGVSNMTGVGVSNAFVQTLNPNGHFLWCAAYVGGPMGSVEVSFDQFGTCYFAGDHRGEHLMTPRLILLSFLQLWGI